MANQYTGVTKSTPLEIAETQNERLQAENRNLTAANAELLDMLTAVWKENQSPDIARLLIQHGVTEAYGAEYTTPRKLDEARAENGRLRAELDEAVKEINEAAAVLNYPNNQETDNESTNQVYNSGFWDCAQMAIERLEAIRYGGVQQ